MALLDIGSISRLATERNVHSHPLAESLQLAVKNGYLTALAFMAFDESGRPLAAAVESLRIVSIALGLSTNEAEEAVKNIQALNDANERNQLFVESIDSIQSRDAALFYLCDFVRFLAERKGSEDLLSAVFGLMKNRITDQDIDFVKEYTPYLRGENIRNLAELVRNLAAADYAANPVLLDYFTPGWNDEVVKLPVQPQVRISDGKFLAEKTVHIDSEYDVALRNAEIEFAQNANIYIARDRRSVIDVSNCTFVCCDTSQESSWRSASPFISTVGGHEHQLMIRDCVFSGHESAWALFSDSAVTAERCRFIDIGLRHNGDIGSNAFWAKSLVFKDCIFENCASTGDALFRAEDIILENCRFVGCHTKGRFFYWSGGAHKFEIRGTKFRDCSTNSELVHCDRSWDLTKVFGFYDCEFDRFSYQGLSSEEMVAEKMNKGFVG